MKKKLIRYINLSLIIAAILFTSNKLKNSSTLFMPNEYKVVKRIFSKIAINNQITKPILFSITVGKSIENKVEGLGICKKESCRYFSNKNPYKTYKDYKNVDINEIIKQTYLLNKSEIYSYDPGSIKISRASFNYFKNKEDEFACYLAKEIIKSTNTQKDEIPLDFFKAVNLIKNAGYNPNSCNEIFKLKNSNSFDKEYNTKKINSKKYKRNRRLSINKTQNNKSFYWEWQYQREYNTLKFIPK